MTYVWGPARVTSLNGSKYYISLTDDATHYCTVYFIRKKSEAIDRIKQYVTEVGNKFDRKPKYIRCDNGKELVNEDIKKWAADRGIVIETTAPYSPQHNGVAERFNRTLIELARAMLIARNLPTFLWAEAVAHAAYIRNRSPTKALDGKTPYEAWTGKKPDVSHFQEFGCDVWVLKQGENLSKLEPKSKKMKFVGFIDEQKSIRYYDAPKRSIRVSRNATFVENDPMDEIQIVSKPLAEEAPVTDLPGLQSEGERLEGGELQIPREEEPIRPPEADKQ